MLKSYQKRKQIINPITHFTKRKCDMCQADSRALVCKHRDKKSQILLSQNYGKTTTNICGTSLYMTCQISFSITSKHWCAIHTHTPSNESDAKGHFGDDSYQNYIKIFLFYSKEEISKRGFGKNREICRKTSNIVDIVGSMIINLSIALHLNKFQFDSKMNQA